MIIALPISRGRLASHFTKAQQVHFYDENHQLLLSISNPALGGNCQDKKALLEAIRAQNTNIVVVQHIGERMLGKLLDAGISVSRGDNQLSIVTLLAQSKEVNLRLTQASQGRTSLKHLAKGGCCGAKGSCGCGGKANQTITSLTQAPPTFTLGKPIAYSGFRPLPK
ncbi:NifB/NifX family molybdenum-iron cluster-binding protein [Shewanella sp. CG12_big_fil_rev_8_21_14_0_65_47_15]|uniref:NifB/NifX family molybdenum-iron cluster-binding protein n=1 Tax=Shewanella sp. CG12_big_fil_rev_8_21_14_0_65_47_15 TaxID=1975537 RepID=UPI000CB3D958|nr:NifB/NifX family molybdenum-iron cluster-binding protein [Shewanella sp. CG12_big_fil_rev_8_21_14_0_65_47_15]PIW62270.1 MAG: dinitrogenase iron-molybdenum cofactor biosynthesis protein [Shewanella sp. CG12_big_fil_rev_8_21_14_0_65_47_15]